MNEKIFLTSEELQQLKDIQSTGFDVKDQFGDIEYRIQLLQLQKENLKKELGNLKEKENQLSKILDSKYGNGSINLETGEFIKNDFQ